MVAHLLSFICKKLSKSFCREYNSEYFDEQLELTPCKQK